MIMAMRPIRAHEEILVEKYQDLIGGVGHDSPGQEAAKEGVKGGTARPRQSKRSAGKFSAPSCPSEITVFFWCVCMI